MPTISVPVSSVRAPADLGEREQRATERLVLRHEEAAGDEPFADDDAAEHGERDERGSRVDGDRRDTRAEAGERFAAASVPRRPRARAAAVTGQAS